MAFPNIFGILSTVTRRTHFIRTVLVFWKHVILSNIKGLSTPKSYQLQVDKYFKMTGIRLQLRHAIFVEAESVGNIDKDEIINAFAIKKKKKTRKKQL